MPAPDPARPATRIETDDIPAAPGAAAGPVYPAPGWDPTYVPVVRPAPGAVPFRPTRRPPVATLVVYDDGKTDGPVIHVRADRFVIGRTEGDLLIPHDDLISTRHVEITRQLVGGLYRWVLTDLQSTNGLFVRVSRTALHDRTEILVGGGRYRFDAPDPAPGETVDHLPGVDPPATGSTHGWGDDPAPARAPALTELVAGGIGNRVVLTRPEYWIGTDPGCAVARPDDPFCEPRHCRVYRGPGGGWYAEHPKTANGLWYRVPQVVADKTVQFQIGEQRFRLRV